MCVILYSTLLTRREEEGDGAMSCAASEASAQRQQPASCGAGSRHRLRLLRDRASLRSGQVPRSC